MVQTLIQTAACAVLLSQQRYKGFHRKQAQVLHKLYGLEALGHYRCHGLKLFGLLELHALMTAQAQHHKYNSEALTACFHEKVMPGENR
jgi:hypothetical protein